MELSTRTRLWSLCFVVGGIFLLSGNVLGAEPADTNQTDIARETKLAEERAAETQQVLRAYLLLQEQMHAAILAIEKSRQEGSAAVNRNTEELTQRLAAIEQNFSLQRQTELASVQNSNRLVLILASIFAGLGFVAVIVACWLQLRAMSRLAEIAATFPAGHALAQPRAAAALGMGESSLAPLTDSEQSSARLRQLVQSLESRVRELEQTTHTTETAQSGHINRETKPGSSPTTEETPAPLPEKVDRVTVMLGKGQALLHLNQAEKALSCFDDVLAIDRENTEALIKKGTALERLRRLEDAIECYDRAIAINDSMTLAYLYKGGVYNQLERFNEALECYEQALRSQQKT